MQYSAVSNVTRPACIVAFTLPTCTYLHLSSLLSLPAAKTPGMVCRHSEKLKTSDFEEKCLKYMNWNMQRQLGDYAI